MPSNNQSKPATGTFIPRNARDVELWFATLAEPRQSQPLDEDGFAFGATANRVPAAMAEAFELHGLVEGKRAEHGGFRRYRITEKGRAALADCRAAKVYPPNHADAFIRASAAAREIRSAA